MTGASQAWRAGDLAVCISNIGWWNATTHEPAAGPEVEQILRVREVYAGIAAYGPCEEGLEFDEWPGEVYPAHSFDKINPDHSAADDADIVALIKGASVRARA
jgi:hypothetical protein